MKINILIKNNKQKLQTKLWTSFYHKGGDVTNVNCQFDVSEGDLMGAFGFKPDCYFRRAFSVEGRETSSLIIIAR